jgi:dihydroflavonol-4-reductase
MNDTLYLLTGAAGLLGSNISRKLIGQGRRIRALVLNGDPAIVHVPAQAEVVLGDLLNTAALDEFFRVPENTDVIVIHCAGIIALSPDFSQKVYDVNVTGTKNIVDRCVNNGVKKLVYISSTSAIPEKPGNEPISEVASFTPKGIVGFYGQTKAEASQLVLDAVQNSGLDASIVFPSGICGPDDYAFGLVSTFIIDTVKGRIPAGVAGHFNAVDVRDLADGVISCAANGKKGGTYIMANRNVTMRELFDIISRTSGCKRVRLILPAGLARLLAFIFETVSRITKKPTILTRFTLYNLTRNNNFCSQRAQDELGFRPRPFEQTIADEVAWLKGLGKI